MEPIEALLKTISQTGINRTNCEEIKINCMNMLDIAYGKIVDLQDLQPSQTVLDYAKMVYGFDALPPLVTIIRRYDDFIGEIGTFSKHFRNEHIQLLPPPHLEVYTTLMTSMRDRLDKLSSNLNSFFNMIYHEARATRMRESNQPPTSFQCLFSMSTLGQAESPGLTDQHRLILFGLHQLSEMNAKKFDNWVMMPKETTTGYNSTAYIRKCPIAEFLPNHVRREQHLGMWTILTSNARTGDWAARVFQEHTSIEFPILERSRSIFAFNNGIYDATVNKFQPYTEPDRRWRFHNIANLSADQLEQLNQMARQQEDYFMRWQFNSSTVGSAGQQSRTQHDNLGVGDGIIHKQAACMYFDMMFDPSTLLCDDPMSIPTPALDVIFTAQNLTSEANGGIHLLSWIYTLVGRMLWDVGTLDDWQIAPFFKGVAGTGKSTILRVLRMFYESDDVGIMANNIEGKFGLAALYRKLMVLCFELRSDFGLDQADLQSLMSGEYMSIPVKFKTAVSNIKWSAPLAVAGNMAANWTDGSGSMSRRWVIIEFQVPVKQSDPMLMKKITDELPRILVKCNRLYLDRIATLGEKGVWSKDPLTDVPLVLPQYFHDRAKALQVATNSLISFITAAGTIVRAKNDTSKPADFFYMKWENFVKKYREFCRTTNSHPLKMTSEDSYLHVLSELGLSKDHCTKPDRDRNDDEVTTEWLIGAVDINTIIGEETKKAT